MCWPFFPVHYNLPACNNTPPAEPGFFLARNKWLRSATSAGQRSNHRLRSRPAPRVGHHLNEAQFSKIIRVGVCIKWRLSFYLKTQTACTKRCFMWTKVLKTCWETFVRCRWTNEMISGLKCLLCWSCSNDRVDTVYPDLDIVGVFALKPSQF